MSTAFTSGLKPMPSKSARFLPTCHRISLAAIRATSASACACQSCPCVPVAMANDATHRARTVNRVRGTIPHITHWKQSTVVGDSMPLHRNSASAASFCALSIVLHHLDARFAKGVRRSVVLVITVSIVKLDLVGDVYLLSAYRCLP